MTTIKYLNKDCNLFVKILSAVVWSSTLLFGLYILAFYATALLVGTPESWNNNLPGLNHAQNQAATSGIGIHFAAGGVILILGCIQLIEKVRSTFPAFHRWTGYLYVLSSIAAGIGGLVFILAKGTIGGIVMDVGFGIYGVLMIIAAFLTAIYGMRNIRQAHKAWAYRLFALAVGSWLYRMDYGFWFMLTDGWGHESNFRGPFDQVMAFFFYMPNLLFVEIILRKSQKKVSSLTAICYNLILLVAILFIGTGTYFFTYYYWGPAILSWIR